MVQSFEKKLQQHQVKVKKSLKGHKPIHRIKDVCSLENGTLLQLPREYEAELCAGFVGFIPAAGASSRFLAPFLHLLQSLERETGVAEAYQELLLQPGLLPDVVHQLKNNSKPSHAVIDAIFEVLTGPKAFFPCVQEGAHFLQMKDLEHQSYGFLQGQVFIAPEGYEKRFKEFNGCLDTHVFTQNRDMSTVRCSQDGEFLKDQEDYSIVPAGHGALTELFSKVQTSLPHAKSLLIRNIDNVTGVAESVVEHTQYFVSFYGKIRKFLDKIREALQQGQRDIACSFAHELMSCVPQKWSPDVEQQALLKEKASDPLYLVQMQLFHTPISLLKEFSLLKLYQRPLNLLGQVPKLDSDVGGTPVLTREGFKLCIELAHVSTEDRETYLAKSTHFNPVLVAAELVAGDPYDQEHPFWIVARKQWKGQSVFYYESLLYELLGNSILANVVFVSVPRFLFQPHKSFADTEHQTMVDLGFEG
ncbi:MAG: DUF4301 family protein [Oligoflexales bacterium]